MLRIDKWYVVDSREDLRQACGVSGGGRRRLDFSACVDEEAAGRCVSTDARVVVESIFVRATIVVDDRLAEVKAVVERSAADAAESGVDGLNACHAFESAARALRIGMKLAIESCVDLLRLVQGWVGGVLCVFNACAGLFEHVVEAGTGPWAHIEKDIVDITHTVEPEDRLVDPAVDGDVRGIEHGGLTHGDRSTWVVGSLSCTIAGFRCFGCKWGWIET